jgi:protein prenyltransferase alpha subunit repeat containing protein 1
MPVNENKSPVIYMSQNLGLESWCIKHIYAYAHKTILNNKKGNMKALLSPQVVKYLNCVILINPDQSSFWNVRRQLFERNRLDITKEFQFSAIVLTKKPKCNEAFAYRRWLFSFQSKLCLKIGIFGFTAPLSFNFF